MTKTTRRLRKLAVVVTLVPAGCDVPSPTNLVDDVTEGPAGSFGIVLQAASTPSPAPIPQGPALATISLDGVASITLEVGSVEAKREGGGWVTAGVVNATVELIDLPEEGLELLEGSLPTGSYEKLRLFLTAVPTITLEEDLRVGPITLEAGAHPLFIPSVEPNGLRLHAEFEVDADGEVLTIVFDASATVRKVTATGSGVVEVSPELQVKSQDGEYVGALEVDGEDRDPGEEPEVERVAVGAR